MPSGDGQLDRLELTRASDSVYVGRVFWAGEPDFDGILVNMEPEE
jgi:hypothetical protein